MNSSQSFDGAMSALNLQIDEVNGDIHTMAFPELAAAKKTIENALEQLFGLLHNHYHSDLTSSLTVDGFPRSDIDVVSVRLIRTKIHRLRNDHTAVLGLLETHLAQQFATPASERTLAAQSLEKLHLTPVSATSVPFALVKGVVPHSPAQKAGLQMEDRILQFDSDITAENHDKLRAIAARVAQKRDQQVAVHVLRDGAVTELVLVPTENWGGRGLLGCHIVPL